jgi:hypothetical protein
MIDCLKAGGPLAEQHGAEVDLLEQRGRRDSLWGGSAGSPADMLLDLVLAGASFEMCIRRLMLTVMMRGALSDSQFSECVAMLLDVYGSHHIATLSALEAAGWIIPLVLLVSVLQRHHRMSFSFFAARSLAAEKPLGRKAPCRVDHRRVNWMEQVIQALQTCKLKGWALTVARLPFM